MWKRYKGELTICKVALGNGMLAVAPKKRSKGVLKPKKFKGTRSASEVENFL